MEVNKLHNSIIDSLCNAQNVLRSHKQNSFPDFPGIFPEKKGHLMKDKYKREQKANIYSLDEGKFVAGYFSKVLQGALRSRKVVVRIVFGDHTLAPQSV